MRLVASAIILLILTSSAFAASFHWVDREGFHSVDQITQVPLGHRRDLPMARHRTAFPFTAEENRDGAMYVWFMLGQAGLDCPYTKAADFPKSPTFRKVQEPQKADIAWWQGYVALKEGEGDPLLTAEGKKSLKTLEKKRGKVAWYRFAGPPPAKVPSVAAKAPPRALKQAEESLLRLDKASTFPPQVKDDAERDLLREEWQKSVAPLEALRKKYPDDSQLLRLLGAGYRLGYNLAVPGAWERAEAYLLRAEELTPEAPEAYISLGILYADSQPEQAELAESQFRTALGQARREQLPQIWWGLALALYYQGKIREAVATIDRLLAIRPNDAAAKKLRETFLAAGKEN
jgi:tetratricopeptide (TPR) repeat protein